MNNIMLEVGGHHNLQMPKPFVKWDKFSLDTGAMQAKFFYKDTLVATMAIPRTMKGDVYTLSGLTGKIVVDTVFK